MTQSTAKVAITVLVLAQVLAAVVWVVTPKFDSGPPGGAYDYRAAPRMLALSEKYAHPSPQNIATWEHELALLEAYKVRHLVLKIAFVLVLDATIIYVLHTYARKTRTT